MSLISTAGGMQEEIALRLNENRTSANNADRYLNWINLGLQDLHDQFPTAPWLESTDTLALNSGDRELEISGFATDIGAVFDLRISSQNVKLPYVTPEVYDGFDPDPSDTGVPRFYTLFDDKIILYPTAAGSYTAQMKYYANATVVSAASAVPSVPRRFLEGVILYGVAQGLNLREDYGEGGAMEQKYKNFVDQLKKDLKRTTKTANRIAGIREIQAGTRYYSDTILNAFFGSNSKP